MPEASREHSTSPIKAPPADILVSVDAVKILSDKLAEAMRIENDLQLLYGSEESPEIDAAIDAAVERSSAIVDRIESYRATTLEGLRLKARAISWCRSGEAIEFGGGNATDVRLAADIINTLLTL